MPSSALDPKVKLATTSCDFSSKIALLWLLPSRAGSQHPPGLLCQPPHWGSWPQSLSFHSNHSGLKLVTLLLKIPLWFLISFFRRLQAIFSSVNSLFKIISYIELHCVKQKHSVLLWFRWIHRVQDLPLISCSAPAWWLLSHFHNLSTKKDWLKISDNIKSEWHELTHQGIEVEWPLPPWSLLLLSEQLALEVCLGRTHFEKISVKSLVRSCDPQGLSTACCQVFRGLTWSACKMRRDFCFFGEGKGRWEERGQTREGRKRIWRR